MPTAANDAFQKFFDTVVGEPDLLERLRAAGDEAAFARLAVGIGRERGFAFDAAEVPARWRAARRASPVERKSDPMNGAQLRGWTPIRIYSTTEGLTVDWCNVGAERFTDPFFEETIARALRNPAQLLFRPQTPLAALGELRRAGEGLAPSGFIFHMSRCGSTLVAQMLAAVSRNLVISEAPPLDAILTAHLGDASLSRAQRIEWLRDIVNALGQPRHGETHFFIKFDCWHTLQRELIHEAFPDVPWIFLYRDPVEVLMSHHRQPGTQTIPGALDPRIFNLDPPWAPPESLIEYAARVLARVCEAARRHASLGRGRLVNFNELPAAAMENVFPFFGLAPSAEEQAQMQRATQVHSKRPTDAYEHDSVRKQAQATAEIREIAARWLAEPHAKLEALRARECR